MRSTEVEGRSDGWTRFDLGTCCGFAPRTELTGGSFKSAARFSDFVADGVSLCQALRTDDVGVLTDDWSSEGSARQLLLGAPADPRLGGRIPIYGCRECLDIDCGGVAVAISLLDDKIRWARLERFWIDHENDRVEFKGSQIGPFQFESARYRTMLDPFMK